ncbi:MAG: 4-(cytidine 5'-diphospho)-2-C-methyl-D-erythritol kinase [Emcibacter sp.]|nr:4-(cytidine 5'-diphospho)-2-C-methyl-D-erythritol kinase [Emcibacter sp.]
MANSHGSHTDKITYMARAKINLDLLITGRRADGYHLLNSLVVFADYGDEISVKPAQNITLNISGPFAIKLDAQEDNLVLKAARLLRDKFDIQAGADIELVKNLPVSSGIGGGSADAAATLHALLNLWQISCNASVLDELTLSLGADVPVCMASTTMLMTGVGEILRPVTLKFPLFLLLVNPGVSVSTGEIFKARADRKISFSPSRTLPDDIRTVDQLKDILDLTRNDLAYDASLLEPGIGKVLEYIGKKDHCIHAAMSGSGATCFGIFSDFEAAKNQADIIGRDFPDWWVRAVRVR